MEDGGRRQSARAEQPLAGYTFQPTGTVCILCMYVHIIICICDVGDIGRYMCILFAAVCVPACISLYNYTKFVIVQVHTYIRTYVHTPVHTYTYMCIHACFVLASTYMYIRTYVGMFVCAYNFMCTHSKCTSLAMSLHWLCITTLLSVYSACTHVHTHLLAICIHEYNAYSQPLKHL